MYTTLKSWLPAATLLTTLILWPGCGDDDAGANNDLRCIPGETQLCVCPNAEAGAQSCEDSGLRFSACICPGDEVNNDANNNPNNNANNSDDHNNDDDQNNDDDHNNTGVDYDPSLIGDATAGGPLFIQHCSVCHGVEGQGTTLGPDLSDEIAEEDDDELWEVILEGEDSMPAIDLTPQETADVVAWLRQQFGEAEDDDHDDDDDDDGE